MAGDIMKLDLYNILGVTKDATEKELVKAYRKKALKCHPDKNPDNPKAADLFHQLSKALEVLSDPAAKAAYDKIIAAKEAVAARNKELDSKRKKFKEDLEARESAFTEQQTQEKVSEADLQKEINRLRKAGSRLLEEEQARLAEELKKQFTEPDAGDSNVEPARLKVRWKAAKGDPENGGYSSEYLREILSKYGEITALVVSAKKKGSGLIEFASAYDADMVIRKGPVCREFLVLQITLLKNAEAVEIEIGNPENPLSFTWLSGKPEESKAPPGFGVPHQEFATHSATPMFPSAGIGSYSSGSYSTPSSDDRDFESIVLMRMRQAEERKRLIEQMQNEEEDGNT